MDSDSVETREIEIELMLPGWTGGLSPNCLKLNADYFIEDRCDIGRGLVITCDMPNTGNITEAIENFLTPLKENAAVLRAYLPFLRIAIYNRAFTCTLNINCLPLLNLFGLELSISVYPTSDD